VVVDMRDQTVRDVSGVTRSFAAYVAIEHAEV
jgi:hypothetical protein